MPLSDQTLTRAEELIARYPQPRSALLPILFLLQAEDGYVSPAGVAQAAGLLGLTKAEVGAVATFYTMFRRRPVGKYLVSVCKTLPCQLRGSREISEAMAARLEVPLGGTDQSGMVTVEEVECLAACDGAPVVQVNTENYERLSTPEAMELLEALLRDEVPPPTFADDGSVTEPTTAGLHWRLAGLGDPPADLGDADAAAPEAGDRPVTDQVKVLTSRWGDREAYDIDRFGELDGYASLDAAFDSSPEDLVQLVKDSGLRGRGGAGFPTGMKWGFLAKGTGKPTYLVVNADESEPGTFKDMELLERDPHALVEGVIVSSYAIGCRNAFIYLRGECGWPGRRLQAAIDAAYDKGLLGRDIKGSGFDLDVVLHRGAGAYICGEETALLSSLEGQRGQPKLRPPFPAVEGLYRAPTTVNNVETIATVPWIVRKGVDWFRSMGSDKSPGPKLFSVSGDVVNPGNFEFPLGVPAREVIMGAAGGMLDGKALKAWTPGGSSTPMLTADHLDTPMDFEGIQGAGSLLGTAAVIVLSEDVCIVRACLNFTEFYAHESCGKCTPCREGTDWMRKILGRLETGQGRTEDMDTLKDICDAIFGRSFCALGDGATSPIVSALKFFRDEFDEHVSGGGCPFPGARVTVGAHP